MRTICFLLILTSACTVNATAQAPDSTRRAFGDTAIWLNEIVVTGARVMKLSLGESAYN